MVLRIRLPDPPQTIQDPEVWRYFNDLIRDLNIAFDQVVYRDTLDNDLNEILVEGSGTSLTYNRDENTITVETSS